MSEATIALVTGGSAGLGQCIARTLRRDGFDVMVCARREAKLAAMASEGFATLGCDVGNRDDVARLAAEVRTRYDGLDVLVNCAGVALPRQPFAEASLDAIEGLLRINLFGTLAVTHALLPLLTRRAGSVINFSSTLAQRPRAGSAAYSTTKGGIEAFTRALAVETAPARVRVNCVAPALVRSDIWVASGMSRADYTKLLEARAADSALGRVGEPEDVAELVAFLVSPRASWLTGLTLPVDGGALLR